MGHILASLIGGGSVAYCTVLNQRRRNYQEVKRKREAGGGGSSNWRDERWLWKYLKESVCLARCNGPHYKQEARHLLEQVLSPLPSQPSPVPSLTVPGSCRGNKAGQWLINCSTCPSVKAGILAIDTFTQQSAMEPQQNRHETPSFSRD